MNLEEARDLIFNNELYFSVMLVKENFADGMVAGATYATSDVLRPALQILKTNKSVNLVSGFFIMITKRKDLGHDGVFIFADCALNQNPNAQELTEITRASVMSFRKLIINSEPIVALLSHSSKGSSKHKNPDVEKVINATQILKASNIDFLVDGELQLDSAIINSVAKIKAPDSQIAGRANILIFPDLDAGNIGYKLVERFGDAKAYGPITQGIAKPVNDLSRGCSCEDIIGVVAITAVQAQE